MKTSTKLIALMALLAAGSAYAAEPTAKVVTKAGSEIVNQATATFTDPADESKEASTTSNSVTTTVLPISQFNVVYEDGGDGSDVTTTPVTGVPDSHKVANGLPGGVYSTTYWITNDGNTPLTVTIDDAKSNYLNLSAADVQYSKDSGVTKADSITITVAAGTSEKFQQIITLPGAGKMDPNTIYAASPVATATSTDEPGKTFREEEYLYLPRDNKTLQHTVVTSYNFSNTITAGPPTALLGDVDLPGNPIGNCLTATPCDVTNPGDDTPGYAGTKIDVAAVGGNAISSGGTVILYPKADGDNNDDRATFPMTKFTNNGTLDDVLTLTMTGASGPDANGLFDLGNNVYVYLNDSEGKLLIPDSKGEIKVTVPKGGTFEYFPTILYPDSDGRKLAPVDFTLVAASKNGAPETRVPFKVLPPDMAFVDVDNSETVNPAVAVDDKTPADKDQRAVFTFEISNDGAYAERYTMTDRTVTLNLTSGGKAEFPVTYEYYDDARSTWQPLTIDGANVLSPVVAAGGKLEVRALIDVSNVDVAPVTDQAVVHEATAEYSTAKRNVTTKLTVGVNSVTGKSRIGIGKALTSKADAETNAEFQVTGTGSLAGTTNKLQPGAEINYYIVAKNLYNTAVKSFVLQEAATGTASGAVNALSYVNFGKIAFEKSWSTGTIYFKVNGGNWLAGTEYEVAAATAITSVEVYVEVDGISGPSAGDLFPVNSTITMHLQGTVK